MVSPFPGFNPYLEHPAIWPEIHHWLIISLASYLSPQLRLHYRVAVATMQYKNKPQHVTVPVAETVKQGYLEVREVLTGQVITAVEILSPVNKRMGKGRQQYEDKRNYILNAQTHLVEIDLLREGKPMMFLGQVPESDYRILVSRGDCRPQADLYAFDLQDPIPTFPLPLKEPSENVLVDLATLLQDIYEQGSFDLAIDYGQPPTPPLSSKNNDWVGQYIQLHQPNI